MQQNRLYGTYGESTPLTIAPNSPAVTYGYTGAEYDLESNTYYLRARNYDPATARFLTKDPLEPRQGGDINAYRYSLNNPVNLIDPDGREPITATMIVGGAVVGGVAAGATAYMAGADARTIAISAGIGAAAGAASLGVSAFATSATAVVGANVLIGGSANVATQVALGTPFSQVSLTSAAIGGVAGGIGAAAGLGAGTEAFYRTPVIGNAIGNAAARRSEFITSTIMGTSVGMGVEAVGSCR